MTKQEQLDAICKLLRNLNAAGQAVPVMVEGKRDFAALREMGYEGEILKLNQGESIVDRCDGISKRYPYVILMTDWDDKGMELHNKLKNALSSAGAKPDDRFWYELKRLCGSGVRTVEDLPGFINDLRAETNPRA